MRAYFILLKKIKDLPNNMAISKQHKKRKEFHNGKI